VFGLVRKNLVILAQLMYDPEEYEGLAQEVRVVGVVLSPVCYALGVRVELGIPPGLLREGGEVEEEKGVYGHVPRAVRRGSSGTVPPGEGESSRVPRKNVYNNL